MMPDPAWRERLVPPLRPRRMKRNRHPWQKLSARPGRRGEVHGRLAADPAPASRPQRSQLSPIADETLLAGLRDGDMAAGEVLVARYRTPLLRYLQRLAGTDLAEELHQQTWLSVLDHVGRFQPGGGAGPAGNSGGFKAWLFRIATNTCNDMWRSKGRERNAKEGLRRLLDPRVPHAARPVEFTERNGQLAAALEKLPREQREALVLRYYSDMKFTEIAAVVGCPVNTALTRVHKGILKLRQLMEPE